jgi:hypothetical protein
MKTLTCILALLCLASTLEARSLPFEKHGYPFYSRKIEFVWAAPTNQLPATHRAFKPLSSKFPANVVSNLLH